MKRRTPEQHAEWQKRRRLSQGARFAEICMKAGSDIAAANEQELADHLEMIGAQLVVKGRATPVQLERLRALHRHMREQDGE